MATEAHKYHVGVFMVGATIIGVGAAIWLGASRFFEQTKQFATYYPESVQGLDPGAAVKYRGVPAGHVEAIRIAPDGVLIEVLMNLDVKVAKAMKSDKTLRATLELSGITGLRYIEIDRHSGDALNQAPTLTFEPPAELIPSARSSFKAIQAALADVYQRVMQLDLGGISNDARDALHAANDLLRDQRLAAILDNVQTASSSTNQLAQNLQTLAAKLAPAVDNTTQATADARALFAGLHESLSGKQVTDTLDRLDRLTQNTQEFMVGLQSTIERFDRTVANLQTLTDEVKAQPSLLLFSAPPAPHHPAERDGQ